MPVLDRDEREAVRRELATCSSGWGDFMVCVQQGDREGAHRCLDRLTAIMALLDAIGWKEHPEAPELQPIMPEPAAASWAARNADELLNALEEAGAADIDADLLVLSALRRIAEAA